MHLGSSQKAAWSMIIKSTTLSHADQIVTFIVRHGVFLSSFPPGIYLAQGMIYLASRNLRAIVMNPCFEDAGSRAAVGQCSLPGPIFH